jgi:hypothetical protein
MTQQEVKFLVIDGTNISLVSLRDCLEGRDDSDWIERIAASQSEINNADLILGIVVLSEGIVYIEPMKQRIPFTVNQKRDVSQDDPMDPANHPIDCTCLMCIPGA